MQLTNWSIKNPQFVIISVIIALIISLQAFMAMPRNEDPQVNFPFFIVTAVYPGTSPEDMENQIVDPLEESIKDIAEISNIETSIREGYMVMQVQGRFDIDTDALEDEVVRELSGIQLPAGVVFFDIERIAPAERVNFKLYAFSSDNVAFSKLNDFAEAFEDRAENIEGIGNISIEAMPTEEIRVSLDYSRMATLNIPFNQVVGVLQSNNVNLPIGNINASKRSFTIKGSGGYDRIDDIRNTVISAGENQVIYLKDVADVNMAYEDNIWTAEFNKERSIFLSIKLKEGFNILDVEEKLTAAELEFRKGLPANIQMNIAFEQAPGVKAKLDGFFLNLFQGVVLVGLVILLFLGWRSAFIIILIIPLCVVMALGMLKGSGYGLQQISIAGLVLALGLLVDNGIVVLENINRFISEGYSRTQAALKGAGEVGMAIISSTATTLLAFFPLTQLGEAAGLFLVTLPVTVIYTLLISLVLALTLSPILSKWILRPSNKDKVTRADRFFKWFSATFYEPVLRLSLRFGWVVVLISILVFAFSISLFPKIGVSFFPTADKPLLVIDINGPKGSNMEETELAVNYVESLLDTMNVVENYTSNVGHGNPQIYYNKIPRQFSKRHGQVVANLKEYDQRTFYGAIGNLRKAFTKFPGAEITVEELKNGAPITAPIEIRIIGDEISVLRDLGNQVENIIRNIPDAINISNDLKRQQTELEIALDPVKAGLLGVSELDFDRTVRASINGLPIAKVTLEDDEEYNLVVRMPFENEPTIDDINSIYINNRQGAAIPLGQIATVRFAAGVSQLRHYDLKRFSAVTASLTNLDVTYEKTLEVIEGLEQLDWPLGYRYVVGGEYEEQQQTFGSLGIILLLAMVAIFAVLVLQFKSSLQPLIVFSAIPLAVCGSFFALYISGWPFSFFGFIGMISLIGIVVNNSIILVDYMNQLRDTGMSIAEAVVEGCLRRFKPIVLTTITSILGLIPLTLQGTNQWSPLCFVIIGGMVSSTLLTLVVVPILYKWLTKEKASGAQ